MQTKPILLTRCAKASEHAGVDALRFCSSFFNLRVTEKVITNRMTAAEAGQRILLRTSNDGRVLLSLRVHPGARSDEVLGAYGDALRVDVAVPPERGRANVAVVALLAKALAVAKSDVEIVAGGLSHDKIAAIGGGASAGEVAAALTAAFGVEAKAAPLDDPRTAATDGTKKRNTGTQASKKQKR